MALARSAAVPPSDSSRFHALALEIHDAVMLLAPRGWRRVQLKLERGPDGLPRAIQLTTSLANEATGAQRKPDLGVDTGAWFGNLNEALRDVTRAAAEAGVTWDGDGVAVSREGLDDSRLELLDADAAVARTVRIDHGVMEQLVFTDALFDAVLESAAASEAGQAALRDEMMGHDEWNYDAATCELKL